MNNRVFGDTSAILALANKNDQYYSQATKKLKALLKRADTSLLITTHILAETITRIQRKVSKEKAVAVGNMLMQNARIEIMTPTNTIMQRAWEIYEKYDDQDFSFVDCISFAVMKELNIKKAFTFDKHFRTMKFEPV